MGNMYDRIISLCEAKGVKPGRVCAETGLSRGMISDLKMGRTKELSAKNSRILADYFGVTTDYLFTGEQKENASTKKGKGEIEFDDFTYAMQNESKELTEEDKALLLSMARQLKSARDKRNGEPD